MQYRVAIDPQLGLSAAEFVQAWNAAERKPESSAVVEPSQSASYLPLEVTVALITAAVAIPATIVADFISECLKKKFLDKNAPKVAVTTIITPDGHSVIIVKTE